MSPHDTDAAVRPRRKIKKRRPQVPQPQEQSFFLQLTDWGLLAALFLVPFLMGGRQAAGQLALVVCAAWVSLAWALHQLTHPRPSWKFTRAEPLLLAGIGLGLLQITHLPADVLQQLSPRIAEILPTWSATQSGDWSQLSLYPAATQSGLVTLVAYALLFVVAAQRVRSVDDVERTLRWVCYVCAAMAVFGLVQYLAGNGKFFWVYEHPFTNTLEMPKGSFTNRNHFGQFLALGAAPFVWWIIKSMGAAGQPKPSFGAKAPGAARELGVGVLLIGFGVLVFAELLSLSRGGMVAMFAGALLCLGIMYFKGHASGKLLAGLCVMGLIVGSGLMILGLDDVSGRLENWESGRTEIWNANLEIFSDFPYVGTGTGTHAEVYKMYLDQPFDNREYTHAESSVLQVASETGAAGLCLAGLAVLTWLYWCLRGLSCTESQRSSLALAAIVGCLAANVTHAFFDVVWYVPGCMVIVIVLAASACRLYQLARRVEATEGATSEPSSHGMPIPRFAFACSLLGVGVLGAWMVQQKLPDMAFEPNWHDYLRMSLDSEEAEEVEGGREVFRKRMLSLQAASRANPNNARAHLLMGSGYLHLFSTQQADSQNPMSLSQIRDAALASQFDSLEAQSAWLDLAVGENRKYLDAALKHTRRSLELCPMQGRGYLNLAELSFLEDLDAEKPTQYIAQALTVRPHDPRVIFIAGREAWTNGDFEQGIAHWKKAFHRNQVYQQFIIQALAPNVPAKFFLETFDPDWYALERLTKHFRTLNKTEDYGVLVQRFAETSVERARGLQGAEAVEAWLHAQRSYDALNDSNRAYTCLENALRSDPTSFEAHYAAGNWFYKQEQYSQATEHLVWCTRRRPRDAELKTLAESASKRKLQGPSKIRTVSGESTAAPESQAR